MSLDPNNFKQIQDMLASKAGKSDSQVAGAAHTLQNNMKHKKGKHAKPVSKNDKMAAIRARMAAKKGK